MFESVKNVFRVKEIREKLVFTFLMMVVIRFGSQLPVPGINSAAFANWFNENVGDASNLLNAFTGGSFLNMSILALNITPYITSSIIMQLLTIAFPSLEEMQRDGEEGRKKMIKYTRWVTIGLATLEATAMTWGFRNNGYLMDKGIINCLTVIATLIAGSAFLMWIGEQITVKGIGNGISIVLTINIVSRMPQDIYSLFNQFVFGKKIAFAAVAVVIILAVILAVTVLVILLNDAERRIPVQYSQKIQGRRLVGAQASVLPLKVNTPFLFLLVQSGISRIYDRYVRIYCAADLLRVFLYFDHFQPDRDRGQYEKERRLYSRYQARQAHFRVSEQDPQQHHFYRCHRPDHYRCHPLLLQGYLQRFRIIRRHQSDHRCQRCPRNDQAD